MSEDVVFLVFMLSIPLILVIYCGGLIAVDWFEDRRTSRNRELSGEVKDQRATIRALQEKLVELAADLDDSEEARAELNKRLEEARLKADHLSRQQEDHVRRRPFAPAEAGVVVTTSGCQKVECPFPKPCPIRGASTHHVTCGNCGHRQRIREHRNEN